MLTRKLHFTVFIDTEQPDVILGQESKLDSYYSNSEIFPPGYNKNVFRKDRDALGGGVFIAVGDELDVTEISVCRECRLVLVKLRVIGRPPPPLHIGSFYRHPGHKLDELRLLEENVGKIAKNGLLPKTIIGGDFNLPGIQWNDPISTKHNAQYGMAVNENMLEIKRFLWLYPNH